MAAIVISDFSGPTLLKALQASGLQERHFWREFVAHTGMTYSAFHGRIWRSKNGLIDAPQFFTNPLEPAWELEGDFMVVGDIQLPTTSYDFAALPLAVAKKHLKKPRRVIFAGDVINADAFSDYESDLPTIAFEREVDAASTLFEEYLSVFEEIYWFVGNHERRVGRKTGGALTLAHMRALVTKLTKRVHVNNRGYCTVKTEQGLWRVTHARAYSVQQLNVADQLAQKYQANIISHHEHHLAKGWDRYKRYVVVNNGGLFKQAQMGYAVMDDSKTPNMVNGFTMLKDGYAEVFGPEPYTDWSRWL